MLANRRTAVLVGLLSWLGFVCPAFAGPPTLSDVIAAVRKNEKRYQDIEVVMRTAYDIGDRKPAGKDEVVRKQMTTRFVSQGERFRVERAGGSTAGKQAASLDRVRAFDGQTTRVLEQKAVGNVARERLEDESFIRPHLLVIRYAHPVVPLSVYLAGSDAVRAHPGNRLDKGVTMKVTCEGEAEADGLTCHKVVVKHVLASGHFHDGEEFWLAADRNYLPVRLRAYTYRYSETLPVGVSEVKKLREVKPGVWFPAEAVTTAYEKMGPLQDGRQTVRWRERYVVEKVALDPAYGQDFFTKVDFPKGTAMYEVEKGKIVKSWRHGEE